MGLPSRPLLAGPSLAAALLFVSGVAHADDQSTLERGVNSFEGERFGECVERFRDMLTPGSPSELADRNLQHRARMYFAACLLGLKRAPDAERQMEQIIR